LENKSFNKVMKLSKEIKLSERDKQALNKASVTCCCHSLDVKPISIRLANAYVEKFHRHHKQVQGAKFAIGIFCKCDILQGVAICGLPVGRKLDDGLTCDVVRLCVKEGVKNGCSKLYAACSRIAKEMGYNKIQTYILMSEAGVSLKASGWVLEAENVGGLSWNSSGNIIRTAETVDLFGTYKKYPAEMKQRWSKVFGNCR
jgi:hypothetical protein